MVFSQIDHIFLKKHVLKEKIIIFISELFYQFAQT